MEFYQIQTLNSNTDELEEIWNSEKKSTQNLFYLNLTNFGILQIVNSTNSTTLWTNL